MEPKKLVYVVVGDAGSLEALAPCLPLIRQFADIRVFADPKGAAKDKLPKLGIPFELAESIAAEEAEVVVCGTAGKAQGLLIQATRSARHADKTVIWVGDFYGSGCEAGVRGVQPHILTVIDEGSKKLALKSRPDLGQDTMLEVTGNPAFDSLADIAKRQSEIRVQKRVELGISESSQVIAFGGSASNQLDLNEYVETVERLFRWVGEQAGREALFSFHPADTQREMLKDMVAGHPGCRTFQEDIAVYAAADAAVVQYSTIGLKTPLIGVPTLFVLGKSARAFQRKQRGSEWPFFPQIATRAVEVAWSAPEIEPALERMLSHDEPDYHSAWQAAVKENFSALSDGQAAHRVAELISSYI